MQTKEPTLGQIIEIPTRSGEKRAKVMEVIPVETNGRKGWLVTVDMDGYIPQPFFFEESEDWSEERKARAEMPYPGNMTMFKWDYYEQDLSQEQKVVMTFVRDYLKFTSDGSGLYICSETMGSGKTMLACCIANEIIERYNTVVKFVNIVDYIAKRGEETTPYLDCSLLILDDYGAQSTKQEWVNEIVFRLVDYRHRKHKPTIFTSNLPLRMTDRATARIYEDAFEIRLPEISIRQRRADERKRKMIAALNGGR